MQTKFSRFLMREMAAPQALRAVVLSLLGMMACTSTLHAQQDLETTVPANWTASSGALSISDNHYKQGTQSLRWDWTAGDVITITNPGIVAADVTNYYKNTCDFWMWNGTALPGAKVRVEFMNGATAQYWFDYYLDYTGWRRAVRSYSYDMGKITSPSSTFTSVRITAPATGNGSFYLDAMRWAGDRFSRMRDAQNPDIAGFYSDTGVATDFARQPDIAATTPTAAELADLNTLRSRWQTSYKGSAPSASSVNNAGTSFAALNIVEDANGIRGAVVEITEDNNTIDGWPNGEGWAKILARDYACNTATATASRDKMLLLIRHLLDQGHAANSNSVPGVWYDYMNLPQAITLMAPAMDATTKAKLWDYYRWNFQLGKYWNTASFRNSDDIYCGVMQSLGAILFLTPDDTEAVRQLKGFKRYLEHYCTRGDGPEGMFSPDYLGFHHNAHYNGYMYAYNPLADALYNLRGSSFQVNQAAYETFRSAVFAQLRMSAFDSGTSLGYYGNALCGRKAMSTAISFSQGAMRKLGELGGEFYGQSADPVVARAYNRRFGTSNYALFTSYGVEDAPDGFYQFNYSPLGIYRRANWVASMRAPQRYFWSSEIFDDSNVYGRYQSYGALEILYDGGKAMSGQQLNGWDWNQPPGTTTIALPDSKLVAELSYVDQFERSQINFSGALAFQDGQSGLYAGNFQEKNIGANHNPSFVWRKSWFAFGNEIVCLGSDIANNDSANPTVTTLFQGALAAQSTPITLDGTAISNFPYANAVNDTNAHWLLDSCGTGYIVPSASNLKISRATQTSANHTGTGSPTTGNFAKAWLDHGTAPNSASYEYAVFPATNGSSMATAATQHANAGTKPYSVIERDAAAHVVKWNATGQIGYAVYNAGQLPASTANAGLLAAVQRPCLVMTQPGAANDATLSVVDPDLNFTNVETGYGLTDASRPRALDLTLNGKWSINNAPAGASVVSLSATQTVVRVTTHQGFAVHLQLVSATSTPVFAASHIVLPGAIANSAYSGSLASYVSDPDSGDTLTFTKLSGPAWLSVNANGSLSGTPNFSDGGTASFTVRVTDAAGHFSDAVVTIVVDAVLHVVNENYEDGVVPSAWTGTTFSVATDPVFGTGKALAASAGAWTTAKRTIPTTSLANPGDRLTLSFDFRYTTVPPANSSGLRIGLFDATGKGTYIAAGTGGSTGQGVWRDTGTGFGAGSTAVVSGSSFPSVNDTAKHTVLLSYMRTNSGTLSVVGIIDGTKVTATDSLPPTFDFSAAVVRNGSTGAPFAIDNCAVNFSKNRAPVFSTPVIALPVAPVGIAYANSLTPYASDADTGDSLTFTKVSGPAWLSVAANGTVSGTPVSSDGGTGTYVMRVTDILGTTSDATVSLAVNSAPIFNASPFALPAAVVGRGYDVSLAAYTSDTDPGETLSYAKVSGPAWLTVNADGTLGGVPAVADVGTGTFTLRVTDSKGVSADATASLFVEYAPVFSATTYDLAFATVGVGYTGSIASFASDPDVGDMITYAKVSGPAWLVVNADGSLSGTPMVGDAGAAEFVVKATDTSGMASTAILTLQVDSPPFFNPTNIALQSAFVGIGYSGSIALYASDADAEDSLTFSKVSGPGWLSVTADGALSGTPAAGDSGANSLTVRVTDGFGISANATVSINVMVISYGDGTWTNPAGGSWGNAANWNAATIADGADKIADFSTLNLTANSTVTLDGARTMGQLRFGDTTPSHDWTLNAGGGAITLVTSTGTPTILVNNRTVTIAPVITGTQGFTKTGSGTLILTGANTYTGVTMVNTGTLQVSGDQSAANGGWTVSTSSAINIAANFLANSNVVVASGKTISLVASSASGGSATINAAGSVTNSGTLSVGRLGVLNLNAGAAWTQSGSMSVAPPSSTFGSANMTVNTGATFTYTGGSNITLNPSSGSGTGTGTLTIAGGTFVTGRGFSNTVASTAGTGAKLVLSSGGTLKLTANVASLATTTGSPFGVVLNAGGGVIDTNGFDTAITQGITGSGTLTKRGGGVLTLSGANTYTSGTSIEGGTLVVTGSLAAGGVMVADGATLTGNGALGGAVTVQDGGTLAPAGTLTVNNTLSLAGTTEMEIGKAGAMLTSDKVSGVSTLTYGGLLTVTHNGSDALTVGDSFTLFAATTYGGAFVDYDLPLLADGLRWDTSRLAVDGTIAVRALPVATNDSLVTMEDAAGTIAVLTNDSDADGDTLAIESVTQGAHGTVAINGTSVSYTPATNWSGTDSFSYTVTDSRDGTSTAMVSVSVSAVNDAPVFGSLADASATEDTAFSGNVANMAGDVDAGEALTFSKVSGPAWLNVAGNGAISGLPANGDVGANHFVLRVTDAAGASASSSLTITVVNVNDAPTFGALANVNATEDALLSISVAGAANDVDAGDTLTFSKVSGPDWLTVSSSGVLSGTPTNSDVGAHPVTVKVADAAGASANRSLTITVTNANDAPAFTVDPILAADGTVGVAYTGQTLAGLAADSDGGDTLTFSKVAGPAWLNVAANGTLSGTPPSGSAGLNTFVVRVTDGQSATDDAELRIQVADLPLPWTSMDIGTGTLAGTATYNAGTFTQAGSGALGGTSDKLRFTYQVLTGNGTIIARVSALQDTGSSARVGVMIRESLAANSKQVLMGLTGSGSYRQMSRILTGGNNSTKNSSSGTVPNTWVKLVRAGNIITAYKSSNGTSWTLVDTETVTMATNCYVGLAVASGSNSTLNTSQFSNVSVTTP